MFEVVLFVFGCPTCREQHLGWWLEPKEASTQDHQKIVIRLDPHSKAQVIESERWQWPQVVEPVGARIISSRHAQGARGGYWVVEIAVPRLLTADEFVQNYSEDDLDLADNRQRLGG
jgi:hypothetical protein